MRKRQLKDEFSNVLVSIIGMCDLCSNDATTSVVVTSNYVWGVRVGHALLCNYHTIKFNRGQLRI